MSEYITKGQAWYIASYAANTGNLEKAKKLLDVAPPADVMPLVHAYWIGVEGDGYAEDENGEMQIVYDVFECSHCGCEHLADGEPEWTYCPDCGAIMDLEPPIWKERE